MLLGEKLRQMQVDESIISWTMDYLTGRPQFVRMQGCVSDVAMCSTGAPQGTVLAPFLFNIYTSDIRYNSGTCHLQKFSDDTAIVGCIRNGQEAEYRKLVSDFVSWCKLNQLQLNISKTKEMVVDFRKHRSLQAPVTIDGEEVEVVGTYKYLGVHLDNKLDWSSNTSAVFKEESGSALWKFHSSRNMAGTASVAGEVFVDALPYFDQGYDAPGVREAAAALVEEETRRYRPTKNYLSYLPTPDFSAFEYTQQVGRVCVLHPKTEIMRNEFERLAARQPMELLSMKRYELPAPSSGQKNDITAWQDCVNNSMAQLEHQAVRIENLELMAEYGTNAWKVSNDNLAFMIENAQKELQKVRKQIQDLNWQRKNDQLTGGAKLRELESTWVSLVSKNYEIERAIVQLENEVTQLRQQQGEENKENIRQDF
ncbi:hypothetical protein NFI96_016998 [Prochilodus magdalenae]|nr:hypothetical protein NFI96_016998 [Prochilodus magdalenae]